MHTTFRHRDGTQQTPKSIWRRAMPWKVVLPANDAPGRHALDGGPALFFINMGRWQPVGLGLNGHVAPFPALRSELTLLEGLQDYTQNPAFVKGYSGERAK